MYWVSRNVRDRPKTFVKNGLMFSTNTILRIMYGYPFLCIIILKHHPSPDAAFLAPMYIFLRHIAST